MCLIGEETGKGYDAIVEVIVRAGPKSSGTVAEYTRFHDDKESFTGLYAEKFGVVKPARVRRHWKEGRDPPKPVKGVRATYQAFCFFAGGNVRHEHQDLGQARRRGRGCWAKSST